jgi:hypothetical protein
VQKDSQTTNCTFGFARHISQPFTELKDPFFANAPQDDKRKLIALYLAK